MAGQCVRYKDLPVSKVVLWEPKHGQASQREQTFKYSSFLKGTQACLKLGACIIGQCHITRSRSLERIMTMMMMIMIMMTSVCGKQ